MSMLPVHWLVAGIPTDWRVEHVRNHFTNAVEAGWFGLFHFKSRTVPVGSLAIECDPSSVPPGLSCVICIKPENEADVLKRYHNKPWLDIAGESIPGRCVFVKIVSDRIKLEAIDAPYETRKGKESKFGDVIMFDGRNRVSRNGDAPISSLPELNPPTALPRGNIGTPTKTLLGLIRACRLPTAAVKTLGLAFIHRRSTQQYGAVPYDYPQPVIPQVIDDGKCEDNDAISAGEQTTARGSAPSKRWNQSLHTSRLKMQRSVGDVAAKPLESGLGYDVGHDPDSDAEGWDIHTATHAEDDDKFKFRTHTTEREEYLFDEEVEQIWDKGDASGLVMYTDGVYWDKQRGDFDERTADDFDVDTTGDDIVDRYGEGGVPENTLSALKASKAGIRAEAVTHGGIPVDVLHQSRLRRPFEPADGEEDDEYAGNDASIDARNGYFTLNVGKASTGIDDSDDDGAVNIEPGDLLKASRRQRKSLGIGYKRAVDIMRASGWHAGKGLGAREQGIKQPILPVKHKERSGIGWSEDDVKSLKKRCVEERKKLIEEAGTARITSVVDHLRQLESQQQFADFVRKGGRYTLEEADLHSKKKPVEFVPAESSSAP